jgi:4a-hydroxytetrahydrobiopterin dehydratase
MGEANRTRRPEMVDRLDDTLVADALVGLPAWSGDSTSISRSVTIDGAGAEELVGQVNETAEAMDHHPDVTLDRGKVTISLTTESAGGVTVVDITMASVIEDLIAATTGKPAQHRHHAVLEEPEDAAPQPVDAAQRRSPEGTPGDDASTQDPDPMEPMIGAPSAGSGGPAVLLPSDEPGHSEPGVAQEQDQPEER